MSFSIASAVLYAIRPSTAHQSLPLPRSWAKIPTAQPQSQPAYAQIDPGVGQTVYLNDTSYRVIAGFSHPTKDLVFRLLVEETTSDSCLNTPKAALFTLWAASGEQLVRSDEVNANKLLQAKGCISAVSWTSNDSVAFKEWREQGQQATETLWVYETESQQLSAAIIYTFTAAKEGSPARFTWSGPSGQLVQTQAGDVISPLYRRAPGDAENDLSQAEIALETPFLVKSKLTSSANLADYERGLHVSVNGDDTFIPWTSN